jgi:putative hemolysin
VDVLFISSLAVILLLDLAIAGGRSALTNVSPARLLSQRERWGEAIDRVMLLLHTARRHLAALYILQMLTRFLFAGGVFLLLYNSQTIPVSNQTAIDWLLPLFWLLFLAVIIAWLEWIVAALASRDPEAGAVRLSSFIRAVGFLMMPLSLVPMLITREADGKMESVIRVTEAELKTMVDAGEQEGLIERDERKMIYSIFDLGETLAREIMVPRIDVLALEVNTNLAQAVDALLDSGYSRVPVYDETIDNILGLLYAKDLLNAWRSGSEVSGLKDLVRPAYYVPEAKKADELLAEMQARRIHMAVVVDEYGGVAGIVTLEDIVEEIVGEIQDEFDLSEEAFYQEINPDEYLVAGRMDLDDFNELLNVNLPDDDADTLGGYIYSRIGRVPTGGESVEVEDLRLTVEQVSKRRIRKVRAQRIQPPLDEKLEESHARP